MKITLNFGMTPSPYNKNKGSQNLSYLLTHRETQTAVALADSYRQQFGEAAVSNKDLVFFLGDNADYQTWSATSNKIPCFRMAGGLFWYPYFGRFMVPADKMAALALPTNDEYAAVMGVPKLLVTDNLRCIAHLGNCMHFSTVALVELVTLVSFGERAEGQPLCPEYH